MVHSYLLTLSYVGTRYKGWQIQDNVLTVQGELEKALKALSKSNQVYSLGGSRTDAGVHAQKQWVKIQISLDIPCLAILKGLNSLLPGDIVVRNVQKVLEDFNPRYQAQWKEYHYRFTSGNYKRVMLQEYIAHYPFELDIEQMQKALKYLIGTHPFHNFYCKGTPVKTFLRTIYKCSLETHNSDFIGEYQVLKITGNSFLKQMVRLIVGTLFHVGRHKVSLEKFEKALTNVPLNHLGPVAKSSGLILFDIGNTPYNISKSLEYGDPLH